MIKRNKNPIPRPTMEDSRDSEYYHSSYISKTEESFEEPVGESLEEYFIAEYDKENGRVSRKEEENEDFFFSHQRMKIKRQMTLNGYPNQLKKVPKTTKIPLSTRNDGIASKPQFNVVSSPSHANRPVLHDFKAAFAGSPKNSVLTPRSGIHNVSAAQTNSSGKKAVAKRLKGMSIMFPKISRGNNSHNENLDDEDVEPDLDDEEQLTFERKISLFDASTPRGSKKSQFSNCLRKH